VELKVSYRQWKRIYAAYVRGGDEALIHVNAGKAANRKTKENVRAVAVAAYRDGIAISGQLLRRRSLKKGKG
jgi:hypothetical protein